MGITPLGWLILLCEPAPGWMVESEPGLGLFPVPLEAVHSGLVPEEEDVF